MRRVKTNIEPVLFVALGMIKKGTYRHILKIPSSFSLYRIRKEKKYTSLNSSCPKKNTINAKGSNNTPKK